MKEDILIPPTGGWSAATMYIAVNPNAEAQKRKREEEVTEDLVVNIELKNLTSRLLQFQFGNSDRTFIITFPSRLPATNQPLRGALLSPMMTTTLFAGLFNM